MIMFRGIENGVLEQICIKLGRAIGVAWNSEM